MATRSAKSAAIGTLEEIHGGSNGAREPATEQIDAVGDGLASLERQLRQTGDQLLESAKVLGAAAGRQMQSHPLAAFGLAFVAGVTAARLLRR